MLIEVHIIQNHAPSNLNRDDSGSPKTAIFGGYRRARISSQCLKRCYRTSETFRKEVGSLGMHTRSMPAEIRARLLAHADTLTAPEQNELQMRFKDWAERCQATLAAILRKTARDVKADGGEDDDHVDESDSETPAGEGGAEEIEESEGEFTSKADKLKTDQSVFWRETELRALFDAYRERIEWDQHVPEDMRKAFTDKNEVKPSDMLKAAKKLGGADVFSQRAKAIYDAEHPKLQSLSGKTRTTEEKRIATMLANLILDRFDPRVALKEAGLRPEGIPVDMALFGRMVASPLMHNVEASSQFAHAISTHEFAREFDLWTRVDDRRDKRLDFYKDFGAGEKLESGTDGMGDAEFTSACFYSYFNVDFSALIDNLTGKALKHDLDDSRDREEAKRRACNAVTALLKAAIFERPTGKFNSMATPSLPSLVLVDVRDSHVAVSYADAFARPVDPKNEETQSDTGQVQRVDLPEESARRLIKEANRITKAFGRSARKRLLFTGDRDLGVSLDAPVCSVDSVDGLLRELRTALESPQAEKKDA